MVNGALFYEQFYFIFFGVILLQRSTQVLAVKAALPQPALNTGHNIETQMSNDE